MTQYAVHGEDRKGDPYKLRILQTKRDAEMHMRRLESEPQWRRLWIEPAPKKSARPVRPLQVIEAPGRWLGAVRRQELQTW